MLTFAFFMPICWSLLFGMEKQQEKKVFYIPMQWNGEQQIYYI